LTFKTKWIWENEGVDDLKDYICAVCYKKIYDE